jgi:uncharacterized membrane protein YccC
VAHRTGYRRAIGSERTAATRRAVTTALNTAYDTLLTARATVGGRSRRMTHLMAMLNASSRAPCSASLLDWLRGGRLAWTFTIRLMACVGVAAVASEVLPLQRSYWVVLTVAIVVEPSRPGASATSAWRPRQFAATLRNVCRFLAAALIQDPDPAAGGHG